MKISKDFFIACREVSKDVTSETISLIGLIEGIQGDDLSSGFGPFTLVGRVRVSDAKKDEEVVEFNLKVKNPSGVIEMPNEAPVKAPVPLNKELSTQTVGIIIKINSIAFKEEGEFEFQLFVGDEHVASTYMTVQSRKKGKK